VDDESGTIVLIVALAIGPIVSGLIGMAIGSTKGSPGLGFVLGLCLGIVGWLLMALLSDSRPKCPSCKSPIRREATECNKCGATIPRCPSCNKIVRANQDRCVRCGEVLSQAGTQQANG